MILRAALSSKVLLCLYLFIFNSAYSQESISVTSKLINFPDKLFEQVNRKNALLHARFEKQSQKFLQKLSREEKRLFEKLKDKDSTVSQLLTDSEKFYLEKRSKLKGEAANSDKFHQVYSGHLDSLNTAFSFLKTNNLLDSSADTQLKFKKAVAGIDKLKGNLNQSQAILKSLEEREKFLNEKLNQFGLIKNITEINKQVAYYQAQVIEFKRQLNDPKELEQKLLNVLSASKSFINYFNKHSELAGLFNIGGNSPSVGDVAGSQSRTMLQQDIQQRMGPQANVSSLVKQGTGEASNELDQIKNKLQLPKSNGDADISDYKPSATRTKTFFQRLEFGSNFQSTSSSVFFPTTTDIGLSVGYKLTGKSVVGIGTSGKIGWGKDIHHIQLSGEGLSLRSFLDIKLRGSFYASGGFEYNYQQPFSELQHTYDFDKWTRSGLIGISKFISLNNKLFKKTKAQLLWDFFSYAQIPQTSAFKFRVGYNF